MMMVIIIIIRISIMEEASLLKTKSFDDELFYGRKSSPASASGRQAGARRGEASYSRRLQLVPLL